MTGNEYQMAALRTAFSKDADNLPYNLLINGVMGLCGESGECVDIVKKFMFQGHELNREELAKELGDVAWYQAVAAHAIGYELGTVPQMNVDKLMVRYPDGFEAEKSIHRKEYEHDPD